MAPVTRARAARTKPASSPKKSSSPKKLTLRAPPKRAKKPATAPKAPVEESSAVSAAPKAAVSTATRATRTRAAAAEKPTAASRARAAAVPKATTATAKAATRTTATRATKVTKATATTTTTTTTTTSTTARATRKRPAKAEDDTPKVTAPPRKRTRSTAKPKTEPVPEIEPIPETQPVDEVEPVIETEPQPEIEQRLEATAAPIPQAEVEPHIEPKPHPEPELGVEHPTEPALEEIETNEAVKNDEETASTEVLDDLEMGEPRDPASPSRASRIPRPSPRTTPQLTPQSTPTKAPVPRFNPQLSTKSIARAQTAPPAKKSLKESLLAISPRKLKLSSVRKAAPPQRGQFMAPPPAPTPTAARGAMDPFVLDTPVVRGLSPAAAEPIEQTPRDENSGYGSEIVDSQFEDAFADTLAEDPTVSVPSSMPRPVSPVRSKLVHADEPVPQILHEAEDVVMSSSPSLTRLPQSPKTPKVKANGVSASAERATSIFQPTPAQAQNEPHLWTSSILSPGKKVIGSARRPPAKEKFLHAAPVRSCFTVPPRPRQVDLSIPDNMPNFRTSPIKASPRKPGLVHDGSSSPPRSPKRSPLKDITVGLGLMPDGEAEVTSNSPSQPIQQPVFISQPEIETPDATLALEEFINTPYLEQTPAMQQNLALVEPVATFAPFGNVPELTKPSASPTKSSIRSPERRMSPKKSVTFQEAQHSPPPAPGSSVLEGVIAFVDVNTNEGADASHLFTPLLEEMGAVCVSQWTSNAMEITHVVFKDGDSRTLEKVVASNGTVLAVNIAWPIDCERFNKRVDETPYFISLSEVPGSPQPPTESSDHGDATTPGGATPFPKATPMRTRTPGLDFTPSRFSIKTPAWLAGSVSKYPSTPNLRQQSLEDKENDETLAEFSIPDNGVADSPTTPYFLKPSNLVQKTCPPKQRGQPMFLVDDAQTPFKQRLMLAKRRSLEFAPRVSSPLRGMRQNKYGL